MNVTARRPTVWRGSNSLAIFSRSVGGGHAGRVDHEVGALAQRREHRALGGHAGGDAAVGRERMAPARLLVAVDQRLLGGLEEQHVVIQPERVEIVDDGLQRLEVDAAAHVGDDGGALDLGALVHEQLDQRADHLRRQVVDAEVAGVLEHVHRRRLAGAGEAGDDDEVLQPRLEDGLLGCVGDHAQRSQGLRTAMTSSLCRDSRTAREDPGCERLGRGGAGTVAAGTVGGQRRGRAGESAAVSPVLRRALKNANANASASTAAYPITSCATSCQMSNGPRNAPATSPMMMTSRPRGSARAVQVGVQLAPDLRRHARHRLQLLAARRRAPRRASRSGSAARACASGRRPAARRAPSSSSRCRGACGGG